MCCLKHWGYSSGNSGNAYRKEVLMIQTLLFVLQTIAELSSNILTNLIPTAPLDWLFDPIDIFMSAALAFFI